MNSLFAVQISEAGQDMTSKIANNRFSHGTAAMVLDIFVDRTRMNIFEVYKETIIYLLHTREHIIFQLARLNKFHSQIIICMHVKQRIYSQSHYQSTAQCLDVEGY